MEGDLCAGLVYRVVIRRGIEMMGIFVREDSGICRVIHFCAQFRCRDDFFKDFVVQRGFMGVGVLIRNFIIPYSDTFI